MDFIELKKGSKKPLNRKIYYSELDKLEDAAIVLDNEKGVIFIDFDNLESNNNCEKRIIEGILKEYPSSLVVDTTKGKHLYYKTNKKLKQWTRGFINIGVQCDAKMGNAYAVIKQNGVERNYVGKLSFDNLTELPDILLPMIIGKDIENLCGLKDGEGRHDKLLRHLCQVRVNYSDIDIDSIARFINKYVFDESMTEDNLINVIESSKKCPITTNNNKNNSAISNQSEAKDMLISICKNVVEKYDIHIADNQIYFFENEKYINDEIKLMNLIYKEYEFSRSEYEEILFQIRLLGTKEQTEKSIITLNNGALINGKFELNCKDFSSYHLDVEYDENAYNEDVDNFLQFITNNESSNEKNDLRLVLEEIIGHCLMTDNFPHKLFLFVGTGANGKSTFMNMLFDLFGDLATSVPIKKLERDDYVARLTNKLVNISDDVDFNYITSSQNIKTLASGDMVPARELYSKLFYFKNRATMIFSMNELIVFSDHSFGLKRRMSIIPFTNKIKNPNPSFLKKLTTPNARSYLLKLGIDGMKRIIENGGQMTYSETIENMVNMYMVENDSIYSFLFYGNIEIENQPFSTVYEAYVIYCRNSDFIPVKKNNFSRKLNAKGYHSEVKYVDGTSQRVIVKGIE